MLKEEIYLEALNLCKGEGEVIEYMKAPFVVGCYAGATNLYVLAYLPKSIIYDLSGGLYHLNEKESERILNIIPDSTNFKHELSIKELSDAISRLPKIAEMKGEFVDCSECNGEGEIECDVCGFSHPCKACNGDGFLDKRRATGKMIPDESKYIRIGELTYICSSLSILVKIANLLEIERASVMPDKRNTIFNLGLMNVLISNGNQINEAVETITLK